MKHVKFLLCLGLLTTICGCSSVAVDVIDLNKVLDEFQATLTELDGKEAAAAKADGADFTGANMSRLNAEFAKFKNAILDNVDLSGAKLGGSDLTGASVKGLILNNTDVDSARLLSLKNEESIVGFDQAINLNKARRE